MKVVEVSAIKEEHEGDLAVAISPCGRFFYNCVNQKWFEYEDERAIELFNLGGGKVHRGIFKIKVVED